MKRHVAAFPATVCLVALLSTAGASPAPAGGDPAHGAAAVTGTLDCDGHAPTLTGTSRRDRLVGTPGDDVIFGLAGDDVIRGRGGNDYLCGGSGADKLVGGDGDDELRGGSSGISHGDGETIYHRDTLMPGPGDDILVPGYDGGSNEYRWDTLDFSSSPNAVVADVAADTITGDGNDIVIGDHYAVLGSPHDDVITGSEADDTLFGGNGADEIRGGAGDDHLYDGSPGPDTADDDLLDGGPGEDRLNADDGDDELLGGGGADVISSYGGADRIDAGAGNDEIHDSLVLSADQAIDGGPGRNRIEIGQLYDDPVLPRIVIDLGAGTATFKSTGMTFSFAHARALYSYLSALTWLGTDGADKVEADPTTFDPGKARLVAHGRGGDDRILATQRPDVIDGGAGEDAADARGGDDACRSIEVRRSC